MDISPGRGAAVVTLGIVVGALSLAACGGEANTSSPSRSGASPSGVVATAGESTVSAAEAAALDPHNDADAQFASLMITHHSQAIAMTDIVLARDDLELAITELASEVQSLQGGEVAQLREWRTAWGEPEAAEEEMDGMDHSGMSMEVLSVEEMAELEEAAPRKATKLYLTYMITHHEGSIAMASTEVDDGTNPAAVALAEEMIRTQTLALVQMKTLLAG